MNAPLDFLRLRLSTAINCAGAGASPEALTDAVLALGDLECRWEIRGGDPDDRWFAYRNTREQAAALAGEHNDAAVSALYSLKFTPISVDPEETS